MTGTGGPELYVVPRERNGAAVAAVQRWLEMAKVKPGEPVLRRIHKSGVTGVARLDAQSVSLVLRRRVYEYHVQRGDPPGLAREQARKYSGHSLRVGFAVTAAEAGADVGAIQQALGHRSPAMATRYARAADQRRRSPHNLAGVGLSHLEKR